jgi:integral membrane protein (TIGR01906 family)
MTKQKRFAKALAWLVTVLIPLIIIMSSVRLLITPIFPQVAYRLPGFPDDHYGFTLEDRLHWSEFSINYLVNRQDISYLESLTFENGQLVFNARELRHMEDVKLVVTGMRVALIGAVVGLLLVTVFSVQRGWKDLILYAYWRGGWAVIGIISAILVFVVLNFNKLFNWFHQIFFESGTWQFHPSNTLIRLFPLRFWQDAFIFVGVLSFLIGVLVMAISRKQRIAQSSINK